MKKNHEIRVKLTEEELEKLKRKVEPTGLTISGYIRFLLKNSSISVKVSDTT